MDDAQKDRIFAGRVAAATAIAGTDIWSSGARTM